MISTNALLHKTYRILKRTGLTSRRLLIPYYWLPYNFGFGRALPPIAVNLEMTFRCNLRCQMCSYVTSNAVVDGGFPMNRGEGEDPKNIRGTELSLDEYRKLLDDLARFGVRRVNITGGEPLIKKDTPEIMKHAKSKGLWVSMISNGTVMTDEVCEAFVGAGVDALTISLDGPEKVHNEVRGTNTGYARLVKNVKKLQDWKARHGKKLPAISFSCAVSALNQAHLAEIVEVAEECGIPMVNYGYLFFGDEPINKATDAITLRGQANYGNQAIPAHLRKMSVETIKASLREARERARSKGIRLEFNPPLDESELESRFNDPIYFYTNKCFLPWYETRVNPFGDIYSCQIDTWLGNVREKRFKAIWNDRPYREFRKVIKEHVLLPKCSRCCKLNDRTWDYLPRIALPSWMRSSTNPSKKGRVSQAS
ncbi:MAG TPA: radical SAM protein [Candidatus Saccharimonadales bacterium]|nr:radical SAM protein [Candidatus Saccharimonadales bacterium]